MNKILVIDDNKNMQIILKNILSDEGYEIDTVGNGKDGLSLVKELIPDLVLLDIRLPQMNGMDVLKKIKDYDSEMLVIMITAFGDIKTAVEAMKLGAYDYVTKPFVNEDLTITIQKALKTRSLSREVKCLRKKLDSKEKQPDITGESAQMNRVKKQINLIAPTDMSVIIQGKSGTGKEVVANLIHKKSNRKNGPFVPIDCGADPNDNIPMLPWDLDEDGQVDEYDPDGYVTWVDGWPIYHFDDGVAFHENNFKITKNEDKGWLAAIWSEGLKSRLGNIPEPGYEDWAEFPEVAIAISNDSGLNWQEPIIFNAKSDDDNYAPEIDGMIPCYLYPGDEIEDLGDGYGLLHLAFLDDNSYGSFIQGHGENIGGTIMYSSVKIKFEEVGNNNNTIIPSIASISENYPNPFNPTTTIKYSLNQASDVAIDVFNVKGQKVTTLVNEHKQAGQHEAVWNGKDANNRNISSGVYFYKMRAGGRYTETRKMILLK